MSENESIEDHNDELSGEQLDEVKDAAAKGIVTAQVRVSCSNGEINRAILGYGKDCTNAYKDAENKARTWCYKHGGTQKITRVKCPVLGD